MTRSQRNGFSGALLVAKKGYIILSRGYGLADRELNIPVTNQTVFTTGSITKQFTGAAILNLQMMGKLSVNDPITKYLKDVPADKQRITLHHLLTYTAGFPGAIGGDFEPILRDDFIKLVMRTKLNHKPGERYEYCNVGFSLLGVYSKLIY
jgi:CubicO group peptidase (beta-lactamase class C family)